MAENTFLGLQSYTEDDAYRFKGRTEESQELFRLIVRNDFTVCYAESGEGKTSRTSFAFAYRKNSDTS